ncbi:T9SS type B sorting domain-containing protein [Dyadobacter luticola]|uniref:T9SS type B sorting domain-containing protein n=1 Tax=Dyadobacter luticola TaxID=1979387 RepID=A0A5R9L2E3_9BACT|nr:gliding motility-associated C-terminal domain-containing protein [Dyadobacter luticola]TLV02475.1 T9SS type B sorting domain-containing protein [Dyadobacter luticola]
MAIENQLSGTGLIKWISLLIATFQLFNSVYASDLKSTIVVVLTEPQSAHTDSIILQSPDVTCRGGSPVLNVTGINVTWYADSSRNAFLAKGNTFHTAPLDSTTTFYLTQNLGGVESVVTPIKIEVVDAILVKVTTTPASCGKNDGTLSVVGDGGSERYPLKYRLNDGPMQLSGFFDNLAGGDYKISAQPLSEGCIVSDKVKIEKQLSPSILSVDLTDPKCGDANGLIHIEAYGGNGILTYSLDGKNFSENNLFEQLKGGDFTVWVTDDSLCTVSQNVSLKKSQKLQLNQIDVVATSCGIPNGKVKLPMATGNGNLSYTITGRPEQHLNEFDSLQAGKYQLLVKDEGGCADSTDITINKSIGPVISQIDVQKPACGMSNGQIVIVATGTGGYSYSLDKTEFQNEAVFTQLAQGRFTVTLKDDQDCVVEQNVDLVSSCNQSFFLPSAFTPNKDGINDRWEIFFSDAKLEVQELTLYNRWGEVILQNKPGVISSGYSLWDGIYKGSIMQGPFAYKIRILMRGGSSYVYFGKVFVL